MKHACAVAIVVCACLPRGIDAAQIRPAIPVMVGGQEASEGCTGTATISIRSGTTLNLRAGPGLTHPVIARLSDGQRVEGPLVRYDDFIVILTMPDGTQRSFARSGDLPRVEVKDPREGHRKLLPTYTDKDMHDVTAFLVTLK